MIRKYANKAVAFVINQFNLNLQGARALTVKGRNSGKVQTLVVNPLQFDGNTFLISSRGESSWVKNARAVGEVSRSKGNKAQRYTVEEVSDRSLKFRLMRAYLDKWGWQVSTFMYVSKSSSDDEVRSILDKHPTFRLQPIG